ncbi:hypothetical protein M1M90_00070 [Thermodesulfovibrionales bacterium]|nr:hypothetical protein [Thermodesulfovibrionales bacterium]
MSESKHGVGHPTIEPLAVHGLFKQPGVILLTKVLISFIMNEINSQHAMPSSLGFEV